LAKGISWLSQLNTNARQTAPAPDTSHPMRLMLPNEASAAGSMNMAEAIILPITSEVLVQNPILGCAMISKLKKKGESLRLTFFEHLVFTGYGWLRLAVMGN
jgi:hypothetical protein